MDWVVVAKVAADEALAEAVAKVVVAAVAAVEAATAVCATQVARMWLPWQPVAVVAQGWDHHCLRE